jgi:hypothetical protein
VDEEGAWERLLQSLTYLMHEHKEQAQKWGKRDDRGEPTPVPCEAMKINYTAFLYQIIRDGTSLTG